MTYPALPQSLFTQAVVYVFSFPTRLCVWAYKVLEKRRG